MLYAPKGGLNAIIAHFARSVRLVRIGKLESGGKADKIEGKVQNAIGGLKDTLKGR